MNGPHGDKKNASADILVAILEVFTYEDSRIISNRENHWKDVLMTRNERIGYNKN